MSTRIQTINATTTSGAASSANGSDAVEPLLFHTPSKPQQPTLLDKLGGPEKMFHLMDEFYTRVLVDPQLAKFFARIDVVKLKRHSLNIIAAAFSPGKTATANGTDSDNKDAIDIPAFLATKHKKLFEQKGVTEVHFDRFVGHFVETMQSLQYDPETVAEAEGKLRQFRFVFEEGAAKAAEEKKRKRNDAKIVSDSEEASRSFIVSSVRKISGECYTRVTNLDPKLVAGVCAVTGALAVFLLVQRRQGGARVSRT